MTAATVTLYDLDTRTTPERVPGDFKRDKTGTPYVSDPTGAVVKGGARKGEPKWVRYARPSGYHHQIEDGYNLTKWDQRNIVLGLANDLHAVRASATVTPDDALTMRLLALAGGDRDDKAWRAEADKLIKAAKSAAKAELAADRGTHTHALAEDDDGGKPWLRRLEAGEDLGLGAAVQGALIGSWRRLLAESGLEILAAECKVVNDTYRAAGSLDRIARLTRDLSFVIGELSGDRDDSVKRGQRVITLAAGTIVVLDIKTGSLRLDDRDGQILWWHGYAVQCAIYAGSVPYDCDTDRRGGWEWPIDQRWALIAHVPVAAAIEGRDEARLVLVDLEKGRAAADLCRAAKEWEASRDVFGLAHGDRPAVAPVATPVVAVATSVSDPFAGLPGIDETPATPKAGISAVVGLTFCPGYPGTVASLTVGDPVRLERDPANVHDPNAIRVYAPADGPMIGHLPRDCAALVAPLMDAGEQWSGAVHRLRISTVDPTHPGVDVRCWRADDATPIAGAATSSPNGVELQEAPHVAPAASAAPASSLAERVARLKAAGAGAWIAARWPYDVPRVPVSSLTDPAHLAAVERLLAAAEAQFVVGFGPADATRETPRNPVATATVFVCERPRRAAIRDGARVCPPPAWRRPDDGAHADAATVAALQKHVRSLPGDVAALMQAWAGQARRAGRDIVIDGRHTVRSIELARAMTNAAMCMADRWAHDDELLHIHLEAAGVKEAGAETGACFAALTIPAAQRLAAALERAYDGLPSIACDDDGAWALAVS